MGDGRAPDDRCRTASKKTVKRPETVFQSAQDSKAEAGEQQALGQRDDVGFKGQDRDQATGLQDRIAEGQVGQESDPAEDHEAEPEDPQAVHARAAAWWKKI